MQWCYFCELRFLLGLRQGKQFSLPLVVDFYLWSEQAREKKAECDSGMITLEEYQKWLKNS